VAGMPAGAGAGVGAASPNPKPKAATIRQQAESIPPTRTSARKSVAAIVVVARARVAVVEGHALCPSAMLERCPAMTTRSSRRCNFVVRTIPVFPTGGKWRVTVVISVCTPKRRFRDFLHGHARLSFQAARGYFHMGVVLIADVLVPPGGNQVGTLVTERVGDAVYPGAEVALHRDARALYRHGSR